MPSSPTTAFPLSLAVAALICRLVSAGQIGGMSRRRHLLHLPRYPSQRWLVVGLGNNPYDGVHQMNNKYLCNRHNVGMKFLDYLIGTGGFLFDTTLQCQLARIMDLDNHSELILAKPVGWMNTSGPSLAKTVHQLHTSIESQLIVVHDDMERPLGRWSWKYHGSAGGHNGVKSIMQQLSTDVSLRIHYRVQNSIALTIYRNSPGSAWA